jgi:lysophospholipase L1-like esterase
MGGRIKMRAAALAVVCLLGFGFGSATAVAQDTWLGSWGASPAFPVGPELGDSTVRQVVRLSIGGSRLRVRFTNETGTQPLVIGAARIAKPGNAPGSIDPASSKTLTFAGASSVTVPPGAPVLSDPVDFDAAPLEPLSISLFVPRATGPSVVHPLGMQTAWISAGGDSTDAATLPKPEEATMRFVLSRVEVASSGGTVVTFGDSITDGYGSGNDANKRWPDILAERLVKAGGPSIGVVNSGISGNRVLHDLPEAVFGPGALSRFDRDVLSVPGVHWVIIMESINDIGHSGAGDLPEQAVTSEEIIGGLRQLVARAHGNGVKAFCATLTPYEDTIFPGYYTAEGETKRQAVNQWIRTGGGCDAVIDFDEIVRDPDHPSKLKPAFDVGDHLHPNADGYAAMANAVDLSLFK